MNWQQNYVWKGLRHPFSTTLYRAHSQAVPLSGWTYSSMLVSEQIVEVQMTRSKIRLVKSILFWDSLFQNFTWWSFCHHFFAEFCEVVQSLLWGLVPMSPGRIHYRKKSIQQSLWEKKSIRQRANRTKKRLKNYLPNKILKQILEIKIYENSKVKNKVKNNSQCKCLKYKNGK